MWFSLPTSVKFVYKNHLPNSVICFRIFDTKINCHSESTFKFFNKTKIIVFKFDMDCENPLDVNFGRSHCILAGCQFCICIT